MPIQILMPALSPTMEEGTLLKWYVHEGDKIEAGDILADIETDKATMEVESIEAGILGKIIIAEGSKNVKVNTVLAYLLEEGETLQNTPLPEVNENSKDAFKITKEENNQSKNAYKDITEKPFLEKQETNAKQTEGKKNFISPLARRLAKQNSISLESLKGTGPHGRIIKRDIQEYLKNKGKKASLEPKKLQQSDKDILSLYNSQDYVLQLHDTMRKTIAERLVASKQNVPHFYLSMDCRLDKMLKLRQEINANLLDLYSEEESLSYKLSINDMIVKAIAQALKNVPEANVTWLDEGMLKHKNVDISMAVAIENGLITPIIRQAEKKPLLEIAKETKLLIAKARHKKLKPEEYQGGTTSLSNMGMYGVKKFSAIVNPPQATIFAVGAGEKVPIIENDQIVIGTNMTITLSVDHRAVDGACAASLLQNVKRIIENPLALLV